MLVSIIVAVSRNGAIGKDNELLWRLPDDLKRFKQLTLGHPIVMGRKTFESIGKPLPGRTSIVVTRNKDFQHEGVVVAHSLHDAIAEAQKIENTETFVIGGGELYVQAQRFADRLYITEVDGVFEGDTWFEVEEPAAWTETKRLHHGPDDRHNLPFDFVDYSRQQNY